MSSPGCLRRLSGNSREKRLCLTNEDTLKQEKPKASFIQILNNLDQLSDYSTSESGIHLLIHCLSLLLLNKESPSEKSNKNPFADISQKRKRKHCQRLHERSYECLLKQRKLNCLNFNSEETKTVAITEDLNQKEKSKKIAKTNGESFKLVLSANLNENNDNSNLLDQSQSEFADGNKPENTVVKESKKLARCSNSDKQTKKSLRLRGSNFNSNPHRQLEFPTSFIVESTQIELEKLIKESSHKRRFCESTSSWVKPNNSEDLASFCKDFHLKEQFPTEALVSPPRRIPRLLRRTQSAFCQARNLVEAEQIRAPAFTPCYRRFNSCTAVTDSSSHQKVDFSDFAEFQFLSKTKVPPRVPSAPADLHLSSPKKHQLKLNCNTNAAHHQRELNQVKAGKNFQNLDLSKNENSFIPNLLEKNLLIAPSLPSCEKCNRSGHDTKSEHLFCPSSISIRPSTGIQTITRKLSNSFDSLPRATASLPRVSKSTGTKVVQLPKVETAAGELNSRRKRLFTTGRKLFENSKEHTKLDQDIATSVQCLCRISTEHKCQYCGVRYSAERESIKTLENKSIPKRNCLLDNRIKYIFQRKISEEKPKKHTNLIPPFDTQCREKLFQACLSDAHCKSAQKPFHHLSSNNHNIPERTGFRAGQSQTEEAECFRALCLGVGEFHSLNLGPDFSKKHQHSASGPSVRKRNFGAFTPDHTDMGCIQSVSHKKRVEPCKNGIIADVRATIDQSPTYIEEQSPIVLRYRTPYFRAHAQVIMPPIRNKETWTVGWIQACDFMRFINEYGDLGCSSWEIPALKDGKISAVSDSDGVSYPWYGNTTEIATIVGPTDGYRRMNLTMNDNFYPSVTWDIPVSEGTNAHLTRIVRNQSFITWLAAVNETTKDIFVLKTVRWRFNLEIDIDPKKELGHRANIVSPPIQQQPLVSNGPCEVNLINSSTKTRRRGAVTDNNSNSNYVGQIPITALVRPSANNAQTLIWRPKHSHEVVVVPAKEEHRDSNELVFFNGCSAMHGKESVVKEISKQELIRLQQLTR